MIRYYLMHKTHYKKTVYSHHRHTESQTYFCRGKNTNLIIPLRDYTSPNPYSQRWLPHPKKKKKETQPIGAN